MGVKSSLLLTPIPLRSTGHSKHKMVYYMTNTPSRYTKEDAHPQFEVIRY